MSISRGSAGRSAWQLAVLVATAGCVSVTYIPTSGPQPPKPPDCDVEVFTAEPPERDYREIGVLEGEGSFWQADLEHVLPRLREEACLAGGDALILLSAQRVAGGGDEDIDEELYAFATVIRWNQ